MITQLKKCTLIALLVLAGCTGNQEVAQLPATDTLAPLVSLTPRSTATPVKSKTPLPTFTFTPSISPIPPTPSNTFTPTEVPPIIGIISSLNNVNIREGPGVDFSAFVALDPGTGVEVLFSNEDGSWLNVQLDDGRIGWVSTRLVRIEPSSTPFPSLTVQPDLTSIALGTPFPTAVIGGGTVTATPPRSIVTLTPEISTTPEEVTEGDTPVATAAVNLPVINTTAVFQTATALAGGAPIVTPDDDSTPSGLATPTLNLPLTVAPSDTPGATSVPGTATVQQRVDVLAYCDNPIFRAPAPDDLAEGSTIDVFWIWFAKTPEQVQQHVDHAIYEVYINGTLVENWQQYTRTIRQQANGDWYTDWYVPSRPLNAGQNRISYKVTWTTQITDGYDFYGPGTSRPSEEGTCTFTVY